MRKGFAASILIALVLALGHVSAKAASSWHDQGTTVSTAIDGRATNAAAQNTIYSCSFSKVTTRTTLPSWVNSSTGTLSYASKPVVSGTVSWTSYYKAVVSGAQRLLTGNGLPSHTTGTFPISSSDSAYTYDKNPNSIASVRQYFAPPASPTYSSSPTCVGMGAIGISTSGEVFYNPLDADGYDPLIEEMFDACEGHPDSAGQIHYHHLSPCLTDNGSASQHSTQIGWIFDGYGIYGPWGNSGAKVTNSDLDVCHGHTHSVTDSTGTTSSVYHYHANESFPYLIGCYRGSTNVATGTTLLTTPNTGFWYTSTASGRGFGMEVQGSSMFIGIYTYDSTGADLWYVVSCTLTTTTCTGDLTAYSGGTTLSNIGVASTSPTSSSVAGTFTLTVTSSTTATVAITPTSGSATTYSLTRFPISGSTVSSAPSWAPQTGWWWSSSYSGTGWFIENQGTVTSGGTTYSNYFMVGYAYGSTYTSGQGNWYANTSGQNVQTGSSTSSWSGTLYEYVNGPTVTGSSGSTTLYATKGSATIQFTSSTTATLTLPNGKQIALTRFTFF
ncbi:MAG: YHYH protein [Proteobacteria bacterium]|nr:YHYH protein [Pseudomonadota bacterium]MBI3498175.1 YHYH protein [Pseudomonadota bacterium]